MEIILSLQRLNHYTCLICYELLRNSKIMGSAREYGKMFVI